jgi:hypothetical protein
MDGAAERNDPVEKTIGTWATPGFTLTQEYASLVKLSCAVVPHPVVM